VNYVDTRLAKMSRTGDRRAFSELVDRYKDKIYYLAYRMLGNVQEAEDIVQETFLRVFANLYRYNENQKFSTWIYRIATNLCIDRLRKRKAVYSLDAEMPDQEGREYYTTLNSKDPTPEQQYVLSETQETIRRAIDSMPEKYKAVILLRYMHDMSLQEIGEALDMPVTTVKTRVHRGREYLRKKLEGQKLLTF